MRLFTLTILGLFALLPYQSPPVNASAVIEGIVTNQGTKSPVQGVTVTTTHDDGTSRIAITSENGRFRIDSLAPGRYRVHVVRTGFVLAPTLNGQVSLTLRAEERLNIAFQLTPTSVITGRVMNENGDPLVSATVSAVKIQYKNGLRLLTACRGQNEPPSVRTNEMGEYRLYGLEPAKYFVAVALGENACAALFYPGVTDPGDAIQVDALTGTEVNGIDFRHRPTGSHSVKFKIIAPPHPVPSVQIGAVQVVRKGRNGLLTSQLFRGTAPVDGIYKSPALVPGSYDLFMDYALGIHIGHISFEIVDRDVDAGTMLISPAIALGGQLLSVGEVPTDWTWDKASVILRPLDARDERMSRMLGILNRVSADGTFLLAFAPNAGTTERPGTISAGRYQIEVGGLFGNLYLNSARYAGKDVLVEGLTIDGIDRGPLQLTLQTGGSIEGEVRDPKNEVVADSQVVLIPPINRRGNLSLFKTARTDQHGAFEVRGVAPGDYVIVARRGLAAFSWLDPEFVKEMSPRGTKVSVVAGTSVRTIVFTDQAN